MLHVWTDEDAAFAAAQWYSGILHKEIGRVFGYSTDASATSTVCKKIGKFVEKYGDAAGWYNQYDMDVRRALVKDAVAAFVAARAATTPAG